VSEVLIWARRWARRPEAPEHELLEVSAAATMETVRTAYRKLARFAHPDLHRAAVSAAELEEITRSFARVSNAYSVLSARLRQQAQPQLGAPAGAPADPAAHAASRPGRQPPSAVTERMARPASSFGPSSSTGPATGLSSKAMLHYRRAERCLRRGELVEARLHLKLALATDPGSTLLRRTLEELGRK
jgi:DnaJ-class molecular chaperone